MREIKFRAWCLDYKVMVDTFYICSEGTAYDTPSKTYGIPNIEVAENPNLVLMQCTGVKDKDGVEIFEGDIVEKPDDKFCSVGAIKMKNGCWMVVASESHYLNLHWYSSEVGVIGNIHQHPQLLGDNE